MLYEINRKLILLDVLNVLNVSNLSLIKKKKPYLKSTQLESSFATLVSNSEAVS